MLATTAVRQPTPSVAFTSPHNVTRLDVQPHHVNVFAPYPLGLPEYIKQMVGVRKIVPTGGKSGNLYVETVNVRGTVAGIKDYLSRHEFTSQINGLDSPITPQKSQQIEIIRPAEIAEEDDPFYAKFDLETRLTLKRRAEKVAEYTSDMLISLWRIGEQFAIAQSELAKPGRGGEGVFVEWLETKTSYSKDTAYRAIGVYKKFNMAMLAEARIAKTALYFLSSESVPDSARAEAIEKAQTSRVTKAEAKTIAARHDPPAYLTDLPPNIQKAFLQGFKDTDGVVMVTLGHIEAMKPLIGLDLKGADIRRGVFRDDTDIAYHPDTICRKMVLDGLPVKVVENAVAKVLAEVAKAKAAIDNPAQNRKWKPEPTPQSETYPTGVEGWEWLEGREEVINTATEEVLSADEFEAQKEILTATAPTKKKKRRSSSYTPQDNRTAGQIAGDNRAVNGSPWAANTSTVAGAMAEQVDRVNALTQQREALIAEFSELLVELTASQLDTIGDRLVDLRAEVDSWNG